MCAKLKRKQEVNDTMQSFQMIKPSAILAPYVRHYWILQDEAIVPVTERTLPVGCVQLVFHRGKQLLLQKEGQLQPQAFICGQSAGYSDVLSTGKIEMITVVFQPYASKVFLQLPVHLFYGKNVATDEVEDRELDDLAKRIADTSDHHQCIRLIEQFFLKRLHAFSEYNLNRMPAVFSEIDKHSQVSVVRLAETACLSTKQFGRIFADYVGATPKEFIRIVRMQRALSMLQQDVTIPFAQVAYECGFSDQSHMIKEFKLFSGYTPAEYLSICAPYSDYFTDI